MTSKFITKVKCPDCGDRLYKRKMTNKVWCEKCFKMKDVIINE